jgi:hypothetical protein
MTAACHRHAACSLNPTESRRRPAMMSFKYRSRAGRLDLRRRDFESSRSADSSQFPGADASDTPRAWSASSLELQRGVQVTEEPMDTLPGELLDEFFKR